MYNPGVFEFILCAISLPKTELRIMLIPILTLKGMVSKFGAFIEDSMKAIANEKAGILIYLRQEGRGIGLVNKLRAYALQDKGVDTVDANTQLGFDEDERQYDQAIKMIEDLGVKSIRLMTNNPLKLNAFNDTGIDVVRCDSLKPVYASTNKHYLNTKVERMGHLYESHK